MISTTRDPFELNHFKNLSSHWWDEEGPFQILHTITPLRMTFIKEKIAIHFGRSETSLKPLKGLRILDIGCGGGILCEPLARLGAEVTGIDPVEENIVIAKKHADLMNLSISYLPYTIEDLPKKIPFFDVVIASEIIEHVINPDEFLKASVARLSPKGGMVVTTFNKTLKSYFLGILLAEYVLKWAPPGTHSWEKFIPPEELSRQLARLGLGNQEITGLCFAPWTRTWHLSTLTDINYFLWAARP